MRKLYLILAIFVFLLGQAGECAVKTITTASPVIYQNRMYNNDLNIIENYLFGRRFTQDSIEVRLARIEKQIFNKVFQDFNYAQRMNNIVANYRDTYKENYLSEFSDTDTLAKRFLNRFIGQPTGFTPPVMNTPYNDYGYPAGINRYGRTINGYRYNNDIPANMGAGVQILY